MGYPGLEGRLPTCYSPVRRFTQGVAPLFSLDLHVLGTPPAFVLSQDQTLQFKSGAPSPRCDGRDTIERCVIDLASTNEFALSVRSRVGTFSALIHESEKGRYYLVFKDRENCSGRPRLYTAGPRGCQAIAGDSGCLRSTSSNVDSMASRRRPTASRRLTPRREPEVKVHRLARRPGRHPATTRRRASRGRGREADLLEQLAYPHVAAPRFAPGPASDRVARPLLEALREEARRLVGLPRRRGSGRRARAASAFLASIGCTSPRRARRPAASASPAQELVVAQHERRREIDMSLPNISSAARRRRCELPSDSSTSSGSRRCPRGAAASRATCRPARRPSAGRGRPGG